MRIKSDRLTKLDKDWFRKNQDDILLLCVTGINEIINLKTICKFGGSLSKLMLER